MKRKSFLYVLISLLGCIALTSCNNDDGNEPDSSNSGKCRIVSAQCEEDGWFTYYSDFKFDSNGMIESYKGESDDNVWWNERYVYSSNYIKVMDEDGKITVTYNLENGLITSAKDRWENKWDYIYDDDNHIVKIKYSDSGSYTCTWNDGNLVSYEEYGSFYSISYTANANTIAFFPVDIYDAFLDNDDGRMIDSILCAQGYFGKMPNNLPSKIVRNGEEDTIEISYPDFNKEGYPETMKVDGYGIYSGSTIYKFVWSK